MNSAAIVTNLGRAALILAGDGVKVFPCNPRNKRPYTDHGLLDATTDPDTISEWWTEHPDALIGLPTGAANGLFVVDLDRSENGEPDGSDWRADFEAEHGELDTLIATTPSGGEHLIFAMPDGRTVRTTAGQVAPNVDIRGDGGYVITVPSPGYEYATEHDAPAPAPAELLALLPEVGTASGGTSGHWKPLDRTVLHPADLAALEALEALGGHSAYVTNDTVAVVRPGKRSGTSATIGYLGPGIAKVFTGNWPRLPAGVYDADQLAKIANGDHGGDGDPFASWEPRDLGPAIRGEKTSPAPTVLQRTDGKCLLYPGRINYMHGDSGTGKTWVALEAARQEILNGNHVIWIDFEDADETTVIERFRARAVPAAIIVDRFHYINPDTSAGLVEVARVVDLCHRTGATLCVVDSIGEAFSLEGINEDKDPEVGPWIRRVLRAIADAGPAVLPIDHGTKAADNKLFPSGSKRKRAAISGAGYLIEASPPFSKDTPGFLKVICAKDRHGNYRRGDVVANIRVAPEPDGGVAISVHPPAPAKGESEKKADDLVAASRRAVEVLKSHGEALSGAALEVKMELKMQAATKRVGVAEAERVGAIKVEPAGRGNAKLHTFVRDLTGADIMRIRGGE